MQTPPKVTELITSIADVGNGRTMEQLRADFLDAQPGAGSDGVLDRLGQIAEKLDTVAEETVARLSKIEANLTSLVQQHTIKEFYTTEDLCKLFRKAPYTVREWCRLRRIQAKKVHASCGGEFEWRISHEELVRIQNEGLLPIPTKY